MIALEIDGTAVEVPAGSTVMDAANKLGIYIPHFCWHKKLSIAANCRMCLVQIEKAPKPLPACATPVASGQKVHTHSDYARKAQQAVMEFLLINHPLDCPICDQGGECQLQDLAVGYGASASRFEEMKRVVPNKNLGPLISTDMTRCIHCTRCVRFGQEIAGVMELGMAGRGEHSEILAFVGKTVDSELSGNVIDLCPVGALTSKPFRYTARTWELSRERSVSPHCGLGANVVVQVKQNRVMRVLPLENEAINECWLSDKDRFAYEGLNAPDRLTAPMLREDGRWREVDWSTALDAVAQGLAKVRDTHGREAIGFLATPHSTLEELHLLAKLARGVGSDNVDFRLRQTDFRADGRSAGIPWLGMKIAEVSGLDRALVVGSVLRKDHPLLAHRLRQATKHGLEVAIVNSSHDDLLMPVADALIVSPANLPNALAQVLKAAVERRGAPVDHDLARALSLASALLDVAPSEAATRIAGRLLAGARVGIFLGNQAQHHPRAAELQMLAQALATATGARFGFLGEAANSVGGYLAGAVPFANRSAGLDVSEMLATPRAAYVLLNVEPEVDCANPRRSLAAMEAAQFVVALSAYKHGAQGYANVLLPIAPFTETSGTFVNTEGRAQSFNGCVRPLGDSRPAWKVLRVLGNLLGVPGFDYDSSEAVRADLQANHPDIAGVLSNALAGVALGHLGPAPAVGVERVAEVRIYDADAIARRAPALQKTRDGQPPVAAMHGALIQKLQLREGDSVRIEQDGGETILFVERDDGLPENCVRVPVGHALTSTLGAEDAALTLERVAGEQRVAV
ncbi:MAG: NADH-quinone oxidoreductase subunit NuoG [Burkholderiales bacterium]|nr:NADH-quinone oxidoreductase subunit NuoG [Burkholderiales bacterium]